MMERFFWGRTERGEYDAADIADVGIAIEIDDVKDLGALVEETQVAEFYLGKIKRKNGENERTNMCSIESGQQRRYFDCHLHVCHLDMR